VTAAQLEVWVGVHKGSIDRISFNTAQSGADGALGQMMLHRRRAAVAETVSKFISQVGPRFAPYLDGRAPQAPIDPDSEMAAAAAAGEVITRECGSVPALLFERAMLAEMAGRRDDALTDYGELLNIYPGFAQAAIADAGLALAAGNPGRAIRSLAFVEQELWATREGTAILAEALRGVGMHKAASRYDLATLVNGGHHDSRGNDCAPVDLTGNVASDVRMPPLALCLGTVGPGRALCNDRGVYYVATSKLGGILAEPVQPGQRFFAGTAAAKSASPSSPPSFEPNRADTTKVPSEMAAPEKIARALWRRRRSIPQIIRRPIGNLLYRSISLPKHLRRRLLRDLRGFMPAAARQFIHDHCPEPLRFWKWTLVEIPDRDRGSEVALWRFRRGIGEIFGAALPDPNFAEPSTAPYNKLPHAADEIFRSLVRECSLASPGPPPS
jgi:hypothetical protein